MMQDLVKNDISFHKEKQVWLLNGHSEFNYSDGVREEAYLADVLRQAKDKRSNSIELKKHIRDWPSEYHLNPKRRHLLEGFQFDTSASVLEVGCGCGAITRYLGETFDQVFSVEGSLRRAEIAALRTDDLESVQVLAAPFHTLQFKKKFDLIVCVGVLEYTPSFVKSSDPYGDILAYFYEALSEKGTLLLAIENQFGFKYFSGAPEDHTSRQFEGIEGYPNFRNKVQTFGRKALEKQLEKARFQSQRFFFPFPDYKLPSLVLSEQVLESYPELNVGELISNFKYEGKYFNYSSLFDETLTWPLLSQNSLIPHLANSFLVVANRSSESPFILNEPEIVFWSSEHRKPEFQTKAVVSSQDNKLKVKKSMCYDTPQQWLSLQKTEHDWQNGRSLALVWYQNLRSEAYSLTLFQEDIQRWLHLFTDVFPIPSDKKIEGTLVDACPWNVIRTTETLHLIDEEWYFDVPISVSYLFIRSLFHFFIRYPICFKTLFNGRFSSLQSLITTLGRSLFTSFTPSMLQSFVQLEADFHSRIFDCSYESLVSTFRKDLKRNRGSLKGLFRLTPR